MFSNMTVCRLDDGEVVESFHSGDSNLDSFVINRAHLFNQTRLSANYVVMLDDKVAVFFTLSCDRVGMSDFKSLTDYNRFRRSRFENPKRLKGFPAVKIGRLAVSSDFQGKGLAKFTLDMIKMMCYEFRLYGCRFITVDAYKTRIGMYEHLGFQCLTSQQSEAAHTTQMFFDLFSLKY